MASLIVVEPQFAQLRRLTEISRALTYTVSLDEVMRLAVERGAELLGADSAVLMLSDAGGLMRVRAMHGIEAALMSSVEVSITEEAIAQLERLLCPATGCLVAVPLVVGGAVTGLLAVSTAAPVTDADEQLLSALADQAAVAIENARFCSEVRVEMEHRLHESEVATSSNERALSTLAHDIRTPLGAIQGYCEILEAGMQGPINDRQRETLGRVRLSGRHLSSLLDNVMDMARINAGAIEIEPRPVRLQDVARDAIFMLIPAADAKLQTLLLGEVCGTVVFADPERLRQVLVNLIGNAVKFTPQDGSITVTTQPNRVNGTECGEIRISDSGPGIKQDELASIFTPYYRSADTARIPGVGLGLAISQALIQQMHGDLRVESAAGQGSTFIVSLPVSPGRPTAQA